MKPQRYVYFAYDPKLRRIKIGCSIEPITRVMYLEHHPIFLRAIRGSRKKESKLHKSFSHLRITGEWFKDCAELRRFIYGQRIAPVYTWREPVSTRVTATVYRKAKRLAKQENCTLEKLTIRALEAYVKREANA